MIVCVVAPVDQRFPVVAEDVRTTFPPAQKVRGPLAVMVGVAGSAVTVTIVPNDAADVHPPVVRVTV